jgi:methylmalonyl-CoA carboxyltransferase 5S subunit
LALKGCNGADEDILTYAMFPQVAPKFFAQRPNGPINVSKSTKQPATTDGAVPAQHADGKSPAARPIAYKVTVGGKAHQVTVESA